MNEQRIDAIIVGTGGLAREFTTYFSDTINIVGYSTINPNDIVEFNLKAPLVDIDNPRSDISTKHVIIAIGSPKAKKTLYENLSSKGFSFPSVIHPNAIVSKTARLEEGVVISPFAIVGPNTSLGRFVYCNYHVGIGHDSVIGSFTQINPGAQIGGSVYIHSESLIGSNATLLEKTSLKKAITIGSGAVVLGRKDKSGTIIPTYSKYLPLFGK